MNYAIILSGGTGTRLGLDIPKQYYEVNNKPIIGYVVDTLKACGAVDGIIIVAEHKWRSFIVEKAMPVSKFLGFAEPGENRQLSIYNGLLFLRDYLEHAKCEKTIARQRATEDVLVLIQDAARPCTSLELILRCFAISHNEDGAMPVLPMKDTVYLSRTGERVDELLKRQEIFAGQAPEVFRFQKYLKANEALLPDRIMSINGSSEPAVLAGMNIKMVPGDENNYKITTEADLKRFCGDISEMV